MKTVRIFIASSSELKDDRDAFRLFISKENDRLHTTGIYLEIVQWENFLDAISSTRLQDEYNKAISTCDIVLCLFFTKVGKYSSEEFDTAYQVFQDKGKPQIWTYFKNAQISTGAITEEINTLLAFKEKIGNLGHFFTEYTNTDNLINKYRTQLDKYLPQFSDVSTPLHDRDKEEEITVDLLAATSHNFNGYLTKKLIRAIAPHSRKANDFLTINNDWEKDTKLIPTVKHIIISAYVGVLGTQLRKLMSIGEEPFSNSKISRYIENCQVATKRALQLSTYALLSKLWDHQLIQNNEFSKNQIDFLTKFYNHPAEDTIANLARLLKELTAIYLEKNIELPIVEFKDFISNFKSESPFMEACLKLDILSTPSGQASLDLETCVEAERYVTLVFESLSFFANYKMVSIKNIGYSQLRNEKEGLYLHNYALLEGDSFSNNDQGKIRKDKSPINSYAVLLFKDNYRQNTNLVPFIIDYNGLAGSGGTKICFYSFCDVYNQGDLNYQFIEDNSTVLIKKSENPKPDDNDTQALNKWLADKDNQKDLNLDNVYNLFYESKKTFTGIEEKDIDNIF